MLEKPHYTLIPINEFIKRLLRKLIFGFIAISCSLALGMIGYHHFEHMPWIDAYLNAAMILSGMGPAENLHTDAGKIFAGSYALFSGIVFLLIIAITFSPVIHRLFHKFHIEN